MPKNTADADEGWDYLQTILDREVPGKAAWEIRRCVATIVRNKTREADAASAQATELMMQGENLRDQIKLHAILHGAYDHLARPPGAPALRRVAATPQKIAALSSALVNAIGTVSEEPLLELLREIEPNSYFLARLAEIDRLHAEEITGAAAPSPPPRTQIQ
jgi:hypothetical protein